MKCDNYLEVFRNRIAKSTELLPFHTASPKNLTQNMLVRIEKQNRGAIIAVQNGYCSNKNKPLRVAFIGDAQNFIQLNAQQF